MVELADALASGASDRKVVQVQVLSSAPSFTIPLFFASNRSPVVYSPAELAEQRGSFISVFSFEGYLIMNNCDTCVFAYIDEVTGEAVCDLNLDEDEIIRASQRQYKECPYYKDGDEYKTVRHQI